MKTFGAALFVIVLVVAVALLISRSARRTAKALLERWGEGLPQAGQWRHGFVIVDFDGDGQLDLVHGPARTTATWSTGAAPITASAYPAHGTPR